MSVNCTLDTLKNTEPFRSLKADVLASLARKVSIVHYKAGSCIFLQGQPSQNCLFVIIQGVVELTVNNDKGVESSAGLRKANEFFGEMVALSDETYPVSAVARQDTSCLQVGGQILEELIYKDPGFGAFFNRLIAERMRVLYSQIVAEQSFDGYCTAKPSFSGKKVRDVMSSPVIHCGIDDLVTQAAKLMAMENISALVVLDKEGSPKGLLTERSIVKFLVAGQLFPIEGCKVSQIMNHNLLKASPDYLYNQALVTMIKNKAKHLAVVDQNRLVGIVTVMDMVKTRSTGTLLLTHDIEEQHTITGLARISEDIDNILNAMVAEKASVQEIFEVMAEFHNRITRRVIYLCEQRMKQEGHGPPPVAYCWLNMGSASRREQTLRTDQDNALLYQDISDSESREADKYFALLAGYVVDGLEQCGFEKCKGNVMASNKKWRKSLSGWVADVKRWTNSYNPDDVRKLTIFLDFSPVWGSEMLASQLWAEVFSSFKESHTAHLLTQDDLHFRLPVSFLGTIATEKTGPHKNEINLKVAACVHIVNCVRIFAIQREITEPSTFARLMLLSEKGAISKEDAEFIAGSYETLMMFRIRENLKKVRLGQKADNYINPGKLSKRERTILKDAFHGVARLQKLVNTEFSVFWLKHLI